MAKEMRAVPKLYDFIQWLLPQVVKFPRSHKLTLGDRIINLALDTLQLLIKATYRRQKNEWVEMVEIQISVPETIARLYSESEAEVVREMLLGAIRQVALAKLAEEKK